jgi:hypothetical protein
MSSFALIGAVSVDFAARRLGSYDDIRKTKQAPESSGAHCSFYRGPSSQLLFISDVGFYLGQ